MSTVRTVAATIVLMFCASVSYAQPPFSQSSNPGSYVGFAQTPSALQSQYPIGQMTGVRSSTDPATSPAYRPSYFACWAEVPSQKTAYFSATFLMPAVNTLEDQFRTFVTTQYGPVSKLRCAAALSSAAVTKQVEKWKDSARMDKNAIIDLVASTGDEGAGAPQAQSLQAASIKQDDVTCSYLDSDAGRMKRRVCGTPPEMQALSHLDGFPGGYVPGNNSSGTVAGQSNFQR